MFIRSFELLVPEADTEYESRIDAERCTLELATKSTRTIDRGKQPKTESQLFGGNAQAGLFERPAVNEKYTDEKGYEHDFCCVCGEEVSTHPDSSNGGLAQCGDCGKATCAQHRSDDLATRCTNCARRCYE